MALSQDLINQFVKLTDRKEKPKEVTVNGTYKMINGEEYVQIDGSEIWTPVTSTVEAETGERVKVMIKNHTATVTGNISSPSARSKSVQDLKDEVDEQGNTIKQLDNTIEQQNNSIIQIDNNIKQVNNDILQANNAINQQGNIIKQLGNEINQQGDVINSMNNDITANSNEITTINNTIVQQNNTIIQHGNTIEQQGNIIKQQGNEINQHGNKIEQFNNEIEQQGNAITQLNNKILQQDNVIQQQGNIIDQQDNIITEHGNNITILNSGFSIIDGVLVGLSQAIIDELKTKHLDAEYATIDFANINMAAVTKLFTESGIIKDLVVKEGKITGELVGVTIKGDLIEGNTIAAEKLVVKGSDGLYYKLNIDGLNNVSTEQSSKFVLLDTKPEDWETNYKDYYIISNGNYIHPTDGTAPEFAIGTYYRLSDIYESGLDGTNIVAKSITADKVTVNDLVAFDATIGGFDITEHSIHSHSKSDVNTPASGLYIDDSGQMNLGDDKQYIKYFKDEDGKCKLMIKIDEIYTSSSSKSIAEQIKELSDTVKNAALAVKTITTLYYASDSEEIPTIPEAHVELNDPEQYNVWNKALPTFNEDYPKLYICNEIMLTNGTYNWTTVEISIYKQSDPIVVKSITNLYYASESDVPPTIPKEHVELNDGTQYEVWNIALPIYSEDHYHLYTCKEILYTDGKYEWTTVEISIYKEKEPIVVKSITNLYYSSAYTVIPEVPTIHVETDDPDIDEEWNRSLPTYDEEKQYLFTCKEILLTDGTYQWTSAEYSTYANVTKEAQAALEYVRSNYVQETTFEEYQNEQIENDKGIKQRLSSTEMTVYGDPDDPEGNEGLVNQAGRLDEQINDQNGINNRLGTAENTLEDTGLNDYDPKIKITQRFLDIETDVEQIRNTFKVTGGRNLVHNSVGYFADNTNKPTLWDILSGTKYEPFGYDGDLVGASVSRGKLTCINGRLTTTENNITALLSNKILSLSFKYKNAAETTTTIKVFNGSVTFFEKTFSSRVDTWTEYTYDSNSDPDLSNPSFLCSTSSLQISIESKYTNPNETAKAGFEITDLMLNYGDVKPWELSSNEIYGAMVRLSNLGLEVTATTANTKNFMTTDGILVYAYDPKMDTIIGTEPITKITDDGTLTNKLESTGDIIERDLVHTMIIDGSNNKVYVEYIR